MLISAIVGARPNFMKMAPLLAEARRRPAFRTRLIHTGQHYSPEMSATFFEELQMPVPDVNLEAQGSSQTAQTAAIMQGLETEFTAHRPDLVLVVGDVNSTLAATLVAAKLGIPVAHVEAGLRSFDRDMPEEINRLVTDVLARYLFVTEPSGVKNLMAEGIPSERIFLAGNVMIDTLLRFRAAAAASPVLDRLGLQSKGYAVATLHRPSNVDNPAQLPPLVAMLEDVACHIPVVFSVHPRTRRRMQDAGIGCRRLIVTQPLGYLDFLRLTAEARLVLTDSGGIQEETTILGVPCLTMRDNTERPITIEEGTNRLVGTDPRTILKAALDALAAPPPAPRAPALWDGRASVRIFDALERIAGTADAQRPPVEDGMLQPPPAMRARA